MIERKIGETFRYAGVILRVEEKKKDKHPCCLCYFSQRIACASMNCTGMFRKDKKFVYFVEVKEKHKNYERTQNRRNL